MLHRLHLTAAWLLPRLRFINDVMLLPMFTVMVLESMHAGSASQRALLFESNLLFCALFGLEWMLGLALATDRREYATSPIRIAEFVSSLPVGVLAQGVRIVRVIRVARLLRIAWRARRYRGRGTGLVRFLSLSVAVVMTAAVGLRIAEPETVPTLGDAVWWSLTTLSTVGYGDIAPVGGVGRFLGGAVMVFGVAVFGYLAGTVSALIPDPEEQQQIELLQSIERRLARLELTLARNDSVDDGAGPP